MRCDHQFENHQLKGIIRVKERYDLVDEFRAKGLPNLKKKIQTYRDNT